jgi:hypothetical protein
MRNAFLALILALTGQGAPQAPDDAANVPSALLVEHRPLLPAMLVGAWRGTRLPAGSAAPAPVEVTFADDIRPATILAYFTMGEGGQTLRRLGALAAGQVTFPLTDGGKIILHLDATGRRLLGSMIEHMPDREAVSKVELVRLRDALAPPGPAPSLEPTPNRSGSH